MTLKENAEIENENNNNVVPGVPGWVKQEYFENIVAEEVENFSKITNFKAEAGSAAGDNYASVMVRVLIEVELKDGSKKEFPIMMKTTHSPENAAAQMIQQMNIFDKEQDVYDKIIPAFEKLYLDKGKKVVFGPKSYKLAKDPGVETVVLEDLRPRKFKNANRIEGLDMEHTKRVLEILSQYHAASAVHYETVGPFPEKFNKGMFDPAMKEMFAELYKPMVEVMRTTFNKHLEQGEHFTNILFGDMDKMMDRNIEMCRIKPEDFNVLNHGDSWCNNMMFNYTEDGKLDETILVDFQMCKYGSPAQDLLYFLFSSPSQSIRLENFDYFIKYYHDKLVENLKLLEYPKPIPSLSQLHIDLLKNHGWAANTTFGTLAIVMLEHTENANIDNFIKSDEAGMDFKNKMYSNPKYVKSLNEILPWLENRGMLG